MLIRQLAEQISFEKSKRGPLESSNKVPGPSSYQCSQHQENKNKFSFPKREKFFEESFEMKNKKQIPGPGEYKNLNLSQIRKQVVAAKFYKSKRETSECQSKNPGPGSYQCTDTCKNRSPVATIGNSPKQSPSKQTKPGPGSYEIVKASAVHNKSSSVMQLTQAIRFGKSNRNDSNKNNLKIGPGAYNVCISQKGAAFSISGRNSRQRISDSPGPQSYSPKYESQFRKTQKTIIGKQKKFTNKSEKIPGPGAYDIQLMKNKAKTFYFPKSDRKQNKNEVPGPGAYDI